MNTLTTYFVIYSNTSRHGALGLRPQVMWTFDKFIVEAAAWELKHCGGSLEKLAGKDLLTEEDILRLSIQKLADDGRLYSAFRTDAFGAGDFLDEADLHRLDDEALALVAKFNL